MIHVCAAIGYASSLSAQPTKKGRSSLIFVPLAAADVASSVGSTNLPALFFTEAKVRLLALASLRSMYPMAPSVPVMIWATPLLPAPACVPCGHSSSEPEPSFHSPDESGPTAAFKNLEKLSVVPEPSARRATTMAVSGSSTPGLSAAILGSFQLVISDWKIPAIVAGDSCSLSTLGRLYDIVIGARTVGTYTKSPPLNFALSSSLTVPSVPAKSTTCACRSERPWPDPPPPYSTVSPEATSDSSAIASS